MVNRPILFDKPIRHMYIIGILMNLIWIYLKRANVSFSTDSLAPIWIALFFVAAVAIIRILRKLENMLKKNIFKSFVFLFHIHFLFLLISRLRFLNFICAWYRMFCIRCEYVCSPCAAHCSCSGHEMNICCI